MPRTIVLKPENPTKADRTMGHGRYGAERWYGPHKGEDYKANWGSDVFATEDGLVVFSDMIEGSEERTRYGNTVIINHTPYEGLKDEDKKGRRHIYTLSAHLDVLMVRKGQEVKKGKVIGKSGNSGTKEFYAGARRGIDEEDRGGFHLHFEVIDSPHELEWSKGNFPSGYRKDPINDYIGQTITIKYPLTEEEMKKIQDSLDVDPVIDFKRGIYRFDLYLGKKKVGYFDKHNKEVKLSLSPEEFEKILE